MNFLTPIWFFALAALALPVLIHLWNTRRGKTLKVGSTSWMVLGNRQNRRSLQLTEFLLLLLRLLLLVLLTLLLTQPFWLQKNTGKNSKGWLLIAPGQLKEAYASHQKTIDSLMKEGYEFHFFGGKFELADLKKALALPQKSSAERSLHWDMLRKLEQHVQPDLPVVLLTDRRLENFAKPRPEVRLNLRWLTFASHNTSRQTPLKAWQRPDGKWQTATLVSTPKGNVFRFSVDERTPVKGAADVLRVAIYADAPGDAQYIRAALEAIRDFSGRQIEINDRPQANTDWLFWLSQKPLPPGIKSKHIFRYAEGKTVAKEASLILPGSAEPVSFSKTIAGSYAGEVLWRDALGNPILSHRKNDRTDEYRFFSHLDPAWNTLVWHPDFAEALLQLIAPGAENPPQADLREISETQILPVQKQHMGASQTDSSKEKKDLSSILWLTLLFVFCAERFAAHHGKGTIS